MRVLLFGAGEFGVPTFEHLHATHEVVALISQPDRPAGRNRKLTATPAAQWADDHHIAVLKTDDVNTPEFIDQIAAFEAQAAVVIAFGQKLSPQIIAAAGKLVVNLHSSLLPKFRGAAPINWAVIQGESHTGVSVIGLAQQMDAGLIYAQSSTPIDPLETAGELHDRLAALGPQAVAKVLDDMQTDQLKGVPQDPAQATRAPKLSKADAAIDFSQDAVSVRNKIHGLTPWPGASTFWHRTSPNVQQPPPPPQPLFLRRVKVITKPNVNCGNSGSCPPGTLLADGSVACGQNAIEILDLQLPGKRVMTRDEFVRGNPMLPGQRLG